LFRRVGDLFSKRLGELCKLDEVCSVSLVKLGSIKFALILPNFLPVIARLALSGSAVDSEKLLT
jgi:hypothetical protein